VKTLTKLGEPSFLDCFVEDELGSSFVEKVQILEGPEKGYCEAVVKLFLPGWLWNFPWVGRKTFDVRLHCANSPFGQSHNYRSIWGSNQRRAEKGYCEPVTKLFLWTRNLKTITIDFQSSNLFGSFPCKTNYPGSAVTSYWKVQKKGILRGCHETFWF